MSVFLIWVITCKNTKCDGDLNISLTEQYRITNRVGSMPRLLLLETGRLTGSQVE